MVSGYNPIMVHITSRSNRGPAAAAQNRAALLRSAQKLVRNQGYAVHLSAIARDAGVGQGVLYRHFPTRFALAFAVFEADFAEYELLAESEEPEAFFQLWHALVDNLIEGTAFVDMVVAARQ